MRMLLLCLVFVLASCVPKNTTPASGREGDGRAAQQAVAPAAKLPPGGITRELMLNLSFHEPEIVEQMVVFKNGQWREEDTNKKCGLCMYVWKISATATGDLDGDGVNDGVFLVASHGPTLNSPEFFLFAASSRGGRPVVSKMAIVGERSLDLRSLNIKDRKVRLVVGLPKKRTATSLFALHKGELVPVKGR